MGERLEAAAANFAAFQGSTKTDIVKATSGGALGISLLMALIMSWSHWGPSAATKRHWRVKAGAGVKVFLSKSWAGISAVFPRSLRAFLDYARARVRVGNRARVVDDAERGEMLRDIEDHRLQDVPHH